MIGTVSVAGLLMMIAGLGALLMRGQAFSTAPVAIAIQACAAALMLWARLTFRGRSFHATASPTKGGLVGHTSLFVLGMAALVTAGCLVRMLAEERLLPSLYPEYGEYARKTKRMVPHVF